MDMERKARPWTREEDKWVQTLSPAEVRERTGRTDKAVGARRRQLHVPDGRGRYSQPRKPAAAGQVEQPEKPKTNKAKDTRKRKESDHEQHGIEAPGYPTHSGAPPAAADSANQDAVD